MITSVSEINIPSLTLVKEWESQRFKLLCISSIYKCIYGTVPKCMSR